MWKSPERVFAIELALKEGLGEDKRRSARGWYRCEVKDENGGMQEIEDCEDLRKVLNEDGWNFNALSCLT